MTKRWGPNTKSDLSQTKRAAAKRVRAEIRREVRTTILPAMLDLIMDPDFIDALEASGELDARESDTEGGEVMPHRNTAAGKHQRARRKTKGRAC